MKNTRNTKAYKEMNSYNACAIAEGFYLGQPTEQDKAAAWQYIVDSGLTSVLQGWYGRTAQSLIEEGIIKSKKRKHEKSMQ